MTELKHSTRNPWTDDGRSLGCIKDVLYLCERRGHLDEQETEKRKKIADEAKESSRSLQLIDQRRKNDLMKKETHKVNREIQRRLQDKETQDITHTDVQENRAKLIEGLNSHLQAVASEKDRLISRLQQPYVGDFIKLDVRYIKSGAALFPDIVPILSALSSQLDNIEWTGKVDFEDGRLDKILNEISSTLAVLELKYQSLSRVGSTTRKFHMCHSPNSSFAETDASFRPR